MLLWHVDYRHSTWWVHSHQTPSVAAADIGVLFVGNGVLCCGPDYASVDIAELVCFFDSTQPVAVHVVGAAILQVYKHGGLEDVSKYLGPALLKYPQEFDPDKTGTVFVQTLLATLRLLVCAVLF